MTWQLSGEYEEVFYHSFTHTSTVKSISATSLAHLRVNSLEINFQESSRLLTEKKLICLKVFFPSKFIHSSKKVGSADVSE